jgi:hypothetical protein
MSVTLAGGSNIQVSISAGIGPSVIVNGTSTAIVGTAGVNPFVAGANITITTTGGGITVIGRDPPVHSVNGKSGTVVLSVTDLTAAAVSHTHTTTDIAAFSAAAASFSPVQSVAGRTGSVALTTTDIAGLTSTIQTYGRVVSVQGKTGTVTLSVIDLTAAAASHTHSTADVSGLTAAIQTYSKVLSVQGKTGTVTLTASDLTAAAAVHTHSTTDIVGVLLPSQSGESGKYLKTVDGTATWSEALPSQSGESGKYLKTVDGTATWETPFSVVTAVLQSGSNVTLTPDEFNGKVSIAAADSFPNQAGQSGNFLKSSSGSAQWATPFSLVTTVITAGPFVQLYPDQGTGKIEIAAKVSGVDVESGSNIDLDASYGKYLKVVSIPNSGTSTLKLPEFSTMTHGQEYHVLNASDPSSTLNVRWYESVTTIISLSGKQWAILVCDRLNGVWQIMASGTSL